MKRIPWYMWLQLAFAYGFAIFLLLGLLTNDMEMMTAAAILGPLLVILCGFVSIPFIAHRKKSGKMEAAFCFKLLAIPVFIANFAFGVLGGVASLLPIFFIKFLAFSLFVWIYIFILVFVALFMMLPSSILTIFWLDEARTQGIITRREQILHTILQCIFVADVISAAVLRSELSRHRKQQKMLESLC